MPNDISSCHDLILQQQEQITALKQVAILMANRAALTERLDKNSRNSHKPLLPTACKACIKACICQEQGQEARRQARPQGRDTGNLRSSPTISTNCSRQMPFAGHVLDKSRARVVEVRQVSTCPSQGWR
ncbi:MAG: hypothetical protein IPM82_11735 [Saprospiraceae bacterium]|nr:hypothetical protein [Saprospiraceae bacterium]